jgi:calcium load-activated calcium channel
MPFVPYKLFTGLTHMGLPGDDMTDASAAFFFASTSPWFRSNLQKLLGTAPSRTATKYLNQPVAVKKDA